MWTEYIEGTEECLSKLDWGVEKEVGVWYILFTCKEKIGKMEMMETELKNNIGRF